MNSPWDGSTNDPFSLLHKMVKYLFIESSLRRPETLECELNVLEPMIPGVPEGVLSMLFSKLKQKKLGGNWELDGHYSSRSIHSDMTIKCNLDLNDFGTNFVVRKYSMEEESGEEDTVPVMSANVTVAVVMVIGILPFVCVSHVTLSRTVRKVSRRDTSHKLTTARNFRELVGTD